MAMPMEVNESLIYPVPYYSDPHLVSNITNALLGLQSIPQDLARLIGEHASEDIRNAYAPVPSCGETH